MVDNLNIDLLREAIDSGIIDLTTVEQRIEAMNKQKYLDMHGFKIWQGSNGKWYTYLNTPSGRRQIVSSSEEGLQTKIVNYYQEKVEAPTLNEVFQQWVDERLSFNEISKGTYDRYVNDYKRFFKDSNIKNHKIKFISEDELDIFIRSTIANMELTQKAYAV